MTIDLAMGVVRILDSTGDTVGTGFVVTDDGLIATCAHVVASADAGPGESVKVVFPTAGGERQTTVAPEHWSEPDTGDVAILRLDKPLPERIQPLPLASSSASYGHQFYSRGYRLAQHFPEGLIAEGKIQGRTSYNDYPALQLLTNQIDRGMSGAPLLDPKRQRVVGMVNAFWETKRQVDGWLALAIPSETLQAVCEDLTFSDICPYRGLLAFTEEDAEFFFGREALVADLWKHLRRNPRLLALVGPSGSGKSSVVQAKLVPVLRRARLFAFRPGSDPYAALAAAGLTAPASGDLREPVRVLLNAAPRPSRIVLFIDQFEELFTLCPEPLQAKFMQNLLRWLASDLPVTVIFTLRGDFYGHLLDYGDLVEWLKDGQMNIPPISPRELRAAVAGPAEHVGLRFEPGLVDTIAAEAASMRHPLPLLQSALLQLWQQREDGALTHKAYRQIGRVTGAIGRWAEDVYSPLEDEQKGLVQHVFTRLIYYGEEADTRRRRKLAELVPRLEQKEEIHSLVDRFANARLLVTDGDLSGTGTVEIIHDALLWEWERLKRWRVEQREFYLWRQRLDQRLYDWMEKNQDEGALLRGATLAEAENWLSEQESNLNPGEQDYIRRSVALHERELAEEIQAANRLRRRAFYLSAALVVALLALVGTIVFANEAQQNAEAEIKARQTAVAERNLSRSQELAASAIANVGTDPELSILLAMEAISTTYTAAAEDALRQAMLASRVRTALSHTTSIKAIDFSPDGSRLAVGSDDGAITLWDPTAHQSVLTWTGHLAPIWHVAFSPDGTRLATASEDQTARVWDVASRQPVLTLTGHSGIVYDINFSPDGKRLATAGADKTAMIWDVFSGEQELSLAHKDMVLGAAFSPDGTRLATASFDGVTTLWDAASGQSVLTLTNEAPVFRVAFSPDGKRLAVTSLDLTTKIWTLDDTQQPLSILRGHTDTVFDLAFSPDGLRLATTSFDGTTRVWDAVDPALGSQPILTLLRHQDQVYGLAFAPDGTALATASRDGNAKIWNLPAHSNWVLRLAFSPDGKRLITASTDKTARVWESAQGRLLMTLANHTDEVRDASFSPDGKYMVTASADKTAIIWDAQTGELLQTLTGHTDTVNSIVYSPDGTRLATASYDHTAIIWDATTGHPLQTLKGHAAPVNDVAFSPYGTHLVTVSDDGTGILWDASDGQLLQPLIGHTGQVYRVAFSPDGKRLATAGEDRTVILWDVAQGQPLLTMTGHLDRIFGLAFSPDGKYLATASNDRRAIVWDIASGQILVSPIAHPGRVFDAAFSPDGKLLATAGDDGTIYWHPLHAEDLYTFAQTRLTRWWTNAECQRYLRTEQCPPAP